jgi:DNA-directed RNA polymerase subunit L
MNPHIEITVKNEKLNSDTLTFTLSGTDVSLANSIRRTILSDIPTVVFKTTPYEENTANIIENTTRLNNEIIKQRLSCIPIHIKDETIPLKNYLLEVNVENISDTIIFVTTQDFTIKNLLTDKKLNEKDTREIFPVNELTGYFIDFVRLRPKMSSELLGEKINLTCEFSIGTSKDNGMYNVVSTCSYGFTIDKAKIDNELTKKVQKWKDSGMTENDIDFETKNWKLLDGMRITKKDSFDFNIQTIGVFSNYELFDKACDILIYTLNGLDEMIDTDKMTINNSQNTLANSFDIILENEDYTIGKVIEYMFYTLFYEGNKSLSFCGFKKMHPHDSQSIIRIAYHNAVDKSIVKQDLKKCIDMSIKVYKKIKKEALKLVK